MKEYDSAPLSSIPKISRKNKPILTPSISAEFETSFCQVIERFQNIETDGSSDKLSDNSPLRKFIGGEHINSLKVITHRTFPEASEFEVDNQSYKEHIAVEITILFEFLNCVTFTIKEIILAPPNPKDEDNYYAWYPHKSKLVAYVDFNKDNRNLIVEIKNSKITMVKKNDALSITSEDEKLIEALKKKFTTVRIKMKYSP